MPGQREPRAFTPVQVAPDYRAGDDRLLVAAEVADLLQVTTGWVYAETRRHRLPHVRLGRYVRYRRSTIERFLADAEAASLGPAHATRPGA